jgi:hypothetical protein
MVPSGLRVLHRRIRGKQTTLQPYSLSSIPLGREDSQGCRFLVPSRFRARCDLVAFHTDRRLRLPDRNRSRGRKRLAEDAFDQDGGS